MDKRLGVIILAILGAIAVGIGAFQAGLAQGAATAGQAGAAAVPYASHYGPGMGFGFFGFLFPLLFIFLIFGLIRAAFGRSPRWGGGDWNGGPRTMFEQWHREAHPDRPQSDRGSAPPA